MTTVTTEQERASFATDHIATSTGSVVNVRMDLPKANEATVLIKGQQNGYMANVTVYDTSGDGTVTLSFDTTHAGQSGAQFNTGDDNLRVHSEKPNGDSMAGAYDLKLHTTSATDAATLTLQPTAVESFTTQTAPGSMIDALDTIANVSTLSTETQTIATNDGMILRLSAPQLSDALAEEGVSNTETASSPESRFLELIRSDTIDMQVTQTNASGAAKTLNLTATHENGGFKLLSNEETVYLIIDTERAVFDRSGASVGIDPGDVFEVSVTGTNGSDADQSASEKIQIVSRTASFDTEAVNGHDRITVKSDANQTLTGETSVAPGTNMTVQVQSNGQSPLVITRTAQVRKNGTFAVTFDFTNVTKGTPITCTIPNQGFTDNALTNGIVQRPSTASVSLSNQNISANGTQAVSVRSVNLSDGGFIAVYDRTFLDSDNTTEPHDDLRGISEYLRPGREYTNESIPLNAPYTNSSTIVAVPYLDTNDNHKLDLTGGSTNDTAYVGADGGPVVNSANVSVGHEPDKSMQPSPSGVTSGAAGSAGTSDGATTGDANTDAGGTTGEGTDDTERADEASSSTDGDGHPFAVTAVKALGTPALGVGLLVVAVGIGVALVIHNRD